MMSFLLVSQLADIMVQITGQARAPANYSVGFDARYTCEEYTQSGGMKLCFVQSHANDDLVSPKGSKQKCWS